MAAALYVVQEGDTLFDIARYELGKASRWAEIYDLNRNQLGSDYDYLRAGHETGFTGRAADDQPDNVTARPARTIAAVRARSELI